MGGDPLGLGRDKACSSSSESLSSLVMKFRIHRYLAKNKNPIITSSPLQIIQIEITTVLFIKGIMRAIGKFVILGEISTPENEKNIISLFNTSYI